MFIGYNAGDSLLHRCVFARNSYGLAIAIEFGVNLELRNRNGQTALELAKKLGYWEIYQTLTFAKLGNKMGNEIEITRDSIELKRGMVKQFLKHFDCKDVNSNEYKSMQSLLTCLLYLIENKLPFSDDLLLLCFHFELQIMRFNSNNNNTNEINPLNTKTWQTLSKVCDQTLSIPQNRRDFLWFRSYVLKSSVQYYNIIFSFVFCFC